ncbi:MAG: hypothetical protein J0L73_23550 [Verrucomicrobia bacterium]|nr:hypothetical protein [Verrucomicrobiota bacterium]
MITATQAREILDLLEEGAMLDAGRLCERLGCTFEEAENFDFPPMPEGGD